MTSSAAKMSRTWLYGSMVPPPCSVSVATLVIKQQYLRCGGLAHCSFTPSTEWVPNSLRRRCRRGGHQLSSHLRVYFSLGRDDDQPGFSEFPKWYSCQSAREVQETTASLSLPDFRDNMRLIFRDHQPCPRGCRGTESMAEFEP